MYEKDFNTWLKLKSDLHFARSPQFFKEREIWWCSVGCNVGEESDGKSKLFSRPVLVLKKLTRHSFVGLPTTTADKDGSWYVPITLGGVETKAMINQVRVFSSRRLSSKLGELDDTDWAKIKEHFRNFYT